MCHLYYTNFVYTKNVGFLHQILKKKIQNQKFGEKDLEYLEGCRSPVTKMTHFGDAL